MTRDLPVRRTDVTAMEIAAETVLHDERGEEIARLAAADAAVWEASDGETSVLEIAIGVGLKPQAVWAALDRLADRGLLKARVAPPGSLPDVSRRKLLAGVGLGAGVAAVAAPTLAAAMGSEAQGKAERARPGAQEQRRKQDVAAARPAETRRKAGDELATARPAEQRRKSDLAAARPAETRRKAGDELAAARPPEQRRKQELASGRPTEARRKQGVELAEGRPAEQRRKQG